jgi:hypothetical protein
VDTNILRKNSPESSAPSDEMVETHYAALERGERVRLNTGRRVARVFGMHPREIGRPSH